MNNEDYKTGEHLAIKKGKLVVEQTSKEKLIKLARREIKEWEKFIKRLRK